MTNEEQTTEDSGDISMNLYITGQGQMGITPVMHGPNKIVFIAEVFHDPDVENVNLTYHIHGFPGADNGEEAQALILEMLDGITEPFKDSGFASYIDQAMKSDDGTADIDVTQNDQDDIPQNEEV